MHGNRTYLLNDADGQITETHSVSAGLDYPGVGPEHAWLKDIGRVHYIAITDDQALRGFHDLTRIEGIIPALESSHALAYVTQLAPTMRPTNASWSTCRDAATKTFTPSPRWKAFNCQDLNFTFRQFGKIRSVSTSKTN